MTDQNTQSGWNICILLPPFKRSYLDFSIHNSDCFNHVLSIYAEMLICCLLNKCFIIINIKTPHSERQFLLKCVMLCSLTLIKTHSRNALNLKNMKFKRTIIKLWLCRHNLFNLISLTNSTT